MLVTEVITRIGAEIPELAGRTRAAEDYRMLLQEAGITSAQGGAYVMPSGLRGGRAQSATGFYTQEIDEILSVVLLVPGRQGATIDALITKVLAALCGWVPEGAIGPFTLVRGAMINLGDGALAFQIDFSVTDQLRIAP